LLVAGHAFVGCRMSDVGWRLASDGYEAGARYFSDVAATMAKPVLIDEIRVAVAA
jgi:hypothetical protein